MTFEVRFSPRAEKDLRALPAAVQRRVLQKLREAGKEPARFFHRLTGAKAYRMRVGEYRVLADIHQESGIIGVAHIAHRRNVYD